MCRYFLDATARELPGSAYSLSDAAFEADGEELRRPRA